MVSIRLQEGPLHGRLWLGGAGTGGKRMPGPEGREEVGCQTRSEGLCPQKWCIDWNTHCCRARGAYIPVVSLSDPFGHGRCGGRHLTYRPQNFGAGQDGTLRCKAKPLNVMHREEWTRRREICHPAHPCGFGPSLAFSRRRSNGAMPEPPSITLPASQRALPNSHGCAQLQAPPCEPAS